ncbi:CDP-glycerol glycerophosphotransferase family protein [Lactiplantibacillus pentosus]|uniref:CDP-glycerol glycerophosphotransferase family protein n=1 Tax=Lactiplantibacillus pentosus TaxID=1589 RepID=UPI003D7AB5F1
MTNIFASRLSKIKYLPILLVAYLAALMSLPFIRRQKYVIGGHSGELFEDNGKAFYEFLINSSSVSAQNVIWYSIQKEGLPEQINVDKIGSFKGYFDYFTAKCALYTHSSSTDLAPLAFHIKFMQPIRIYLDHGIDGLKKVGWTSKIEPANGYVVASDVGRKIKQQYWHLSDDLIIDTGLARYDRLFEHMKDRKAAKVKRILYLPTWREWNYGIEPSSFENTEYFQKIVSFLRDSRTKQLVTSQHVVLHVELHPFCKPYLDAFKQQIAEIEHIEFAFGNISDEIVKSDMLITDYSSVCWDFLYQNKPVVFYQFDQAKYLNDRGSYLDFDSQLFGPVCTTESDLLVALQNCMSGEEQVSQKLRHHYFTHIDNKNCARVYSVIEELSKNAKSR